MTEPLFFSLDSAAIARDIRKAQHSVCYAAPGIQREPANAMAELARRRGPELITVCLDFDERVMRMGFGDLADVKTLREAGIVVSSTSGLRTGVVIVDNHGYIFTPTALYLAIRSRKRWLACHLPRRQSRWHLPKHPLSGSAFGNRPSR